MSLFDVIRYPISDPPTRAELEALPEPIVRCFMCHTDTRWSKVWAGRATFKSLQDIMVLAYVVQFNANTDPYTRELNILKTIIQEYNEPI